MVNIIKVLIYALVEGITEWLPVSSTGHLILLYEFIPFNLSDDFFKLFLILIQLSAIFAVIFNYIKKINPINFKDKCINIDILSLWIKIIISTLPCIIIGLLFKDIINSYLYNSIVVSSMLILYGIMFLFIKDKDNTTNIITYKKAFIIGLFESLALIPGTSRSGVTILGCLLLGLDRKTSIEYSFMLSIPVMLGASILELFSINMISSYELILVIIGMIMSFLISLLVIKWLLNYIKNNNLKVFGIYRIIFGIILLVYLFNR